MEPWERVWIDAETYTQDIHSYINCTDCHLGQAVDDMETAHQGLVASPAADAEATCGKCHVDITPSSVNSLHSTLAGYDTALYSRSVSENYAVIEEMETYHCNSCHTTCGDCHISQPNSVGGGLLAGHDFVETPPMSQTCTACHGSRVKNEYYGLNEGIPGDVHFRARMGCSDCHTGDEAHGIGIDAAHRYDGEQGPTCESCHQDQIGVGSGIEQHEVHGTDTLSCQGCHSVAYTNCVNCHVEKTNDGIPFYSVEDHSLGLYLGLNPLRSIDRPYEYVPLRHVPIDINSFSFYGQDLLSNFDSRPTWVYSTPHNIQRITPQTESCTSCHTNDSVFLTAAVVAPAERAPNQGVMVEGAPPLPEEYADRIQPDAGASPPASGGDDFWGGSTETTPVPSPASDFWGDGADAVSTQSPDSFWGGDPASTPTTPADELWRNGESAESTPTPVDAFWGS